MEMLCPVEIIESLARKNRNGGFPREIDSDSDEFCHELQPYIRDGWLVCIRDDGGKYGATAERMHNGSLQFVQESAVYLADLIERIAAAMDQHNAH